MKQNKIIVVVSPSDAQRAEMVRKVAVRLGFAHTPSDAARIIRASVYDFDLAQAYFVLAQTYNLSKSPITTQRLFEMAARGVAVVVGVKRLPAAFEPFCEAIHPENL
jgi:hypothetical protein